MPTQIEFLKHILPPEGLYCSVVQGFKPDTGEAFMHQRFYDSVEDMSARLKQADGEKKNSWFAPAAFKEIGNRKQANVRAVKSYWLDLDVEPGNLKKYDSIPEALGHLDGFIKAGCVPTPSMLVTSGNGVHVWWALDEEVNPERWLLGAQALKIACKAWGLKADPVRTADMASIMRAPGDG